MTLAVQQAEFAKASEPPAGGEGRPRQPHRPLRPVRPADALRAALARPAAHRRGAVRRRQAVRRPRGARAQPSDRGRSASLRAVLWMRGQAPGRSTNRRGHHEDRRCRLGYVGVPLAVAFCEAGAHGESAWTPIARRSRPSRGVRAYIEDIPDARLREVLPLPPADGRATRSFSQADAVIIAVPTPLTPNREPDLGPLTSSAHRARDRAAARPARGARSRRRTRATRASASCRCSKSPAWPRGANFNVALLAGAGRPGPQGLHAGDTTAKVVGGSTPACLERAVALYGEVCDHVVAGLRRPNAAELTKLLENIFRSSTSPSSTRSRSSATAWASTSGRSSTRPPRSRRRLHVASSRARGWAGTACRSTRSRPLLAGARVRRPDRVHRAGRRGQRAHAALLRREDRSRAQRPLEARARLAASRSSACRTRPASPTSARRRR